jgi:hypothetical protein
VLPSGSEIFLSKRPALLALASHSGQKAPVTDPASWNIKTLSKINSMLTSRQGIVKMTAAMTSGILMRIRGRGLIDIHTKISI